MPREPEHGRSKRGWRENYTSAATTIMREEGGAERKMPKHMKALVSVHACALVDDVYNAYSHLPLYLWFP